MSEPIDIESQAITVRPSMAVGQALGVDEIIAQVRLIQEVMGKVMQEGEHYGKIPGCGEKKTLLQPGAQKLTMTFRLAPEYQIQESNLDGGHKEYRVICTLKSIQSGTFVGQGVGCCSTMESKYRWRSANRKCPKCGKETIIKGKAEYGGGWLCFGKKGGCGFKWPDGAAEIESQSEAKVEHDNPADHFNCVTPDTKVLTHDLQWIPAGEIESGDMLIGVEEEMTNEYARHLAVGEATVNGRRIEALYEVTFTDGRVVRCNGEHRWLVKKVGLKGTEWVATQDIHKEMEKAAGRPRKWSVMGVCTPWTEDISKEAGYIAGLLDADGSFGTVQLNVMFAQQMNTVLARLEYGLIHRGYKLGRTACKSPEALEQTRSQKQVYSVRVLGGFTEQIRLLGTIRPPRLLERWLTLIDLESRRLEGRGSGAGKPVGIVSVESVGEGEIVLLGTSCHTYLAEGLVCHNTVLKMAKKRAFVDATITATAASDIFTQDIGDAENVTGDEDIDGHTDSVRKEEPKQSAKPANVPHNPSAPGSTAKRADVAKPTSVAPVATEKTRAWFLAEMRKRFEDKVILQWGVDSMNPTYLMPDEGLAEWPLKFVPTSKAALDAKIAECASFMHVEPQNMAGKPQEASGPPSDTSPPAKDAQKAASRKESSPSEPAHHSEEWWNFPTPWGKHAGTPLGKLEKNYLYGLWKNYTVETEWKGKPIAKDKIEAGRHFQVMLDMAAVHYRFDEPKDGDQEPEPRQGPEGPDDLPFS